MWAPLYEEMTGWGFRKADSELRESANRLLADWKRDGTLEAILASYMPYLDRINWRPEE